jgi:transcriptional regulator with XRE-family HTH domain
MSEKSLGPDENERLRAILQKLLDERFDGNKSEAARKLKLSQSFVTEILAGRRGGGNKALRAIADFTGKSLDELSGRPSASSRIEYDIATGLDASSLGRRHDFAEAREDCELRYGKWLAKYPGILDKTAGLALGRSFDHLNGDVLFKLAEALIAGDEKAT